MRIPTKSELEKLRKEFPKGCRIVLDEMDDVQAPKPGSQGTCQGADTCHCVASEEEIRQSLDWLGKRRHRGTRCPRCGACKEAGTRLLAQSHRADITVCEACGMLEGLEDAGLLERLPLAEWWIVKKGLGGSFPR